MANFCRVQMFIDWDTARRIAAPNLRRTQSARLSSALDTLQLRTAELLKRRFQYSLYRVSMRFYHGWHRGKTATPDRRELESCPELQDTARAIERVSFSGTPTYGDRLLCEPRRGPLWDTLRRREDGRFDEQKMVDTALVCDLLHLTRARQFDVGIVIGDDDDLLPGVFTAEAWGAKMIVGRLRKNDNPHLSTGGLIERYA